MKKVGSMIHYDLYTFEEELNAIYDLINLKNKTFIEQSCCVFSQLLCQGLLSVFPSNRHGLSCTVNISCNDCKYSLSMGISTQIPKEPAE